MTLDLLKQEAERKCTAKGHKLHPWTKVSANRAFSECARCRRWVSVSTQNGYIGGTAIRLDCR